MTYDPEAFFAFATNEKKFDRGRSRTKISAIKLTSVYATFSTMVMLLSNRELPAASANDDDDAADSISGESSIPEASTNHSTTEQEASNISQEVSQVKLVQRETRYVMMLRAGVIFILLLAAIAVSTLVFMVAKQAEAEIFESNYEAAAEKVTETFLNIAREKMGAAGSFVVAITSEALATGQQWPFVTLSAFQEKTTTIKDLSGSLYIGRNPVIPHRLRIEWEQYTSYTTDWYKQAMEHQEALGINNLDDRLQIETDDPNLHLDSGIANFIYDYNRDGQDHGSNTTLKAVISPPADFYVPVWQVSPVTRRSVVNQNRASNSQAIEVCTANEAIVFEGMERALPGYSNDNNARTAEIAWLLSMKAKSKVRYNGDVYTSVYYPVFDNFSVSRRAVAATRFVIHWASYFEGILPYNTVGIIVVLENSCDLPFSYIINGEKVVPLGDGDLHDSKYDKYERSASFRDAGVIADGSAMGTLIDVGGCPYSIHVYPSSEFAGAFKSNTPRLLTITVSGIFVFTVFVFFFYDFLVERRQRKLMMKATQTHEIVASLFPKNVHDRLMSECNDMKKGSGLLAPNQRLKSFLNGDVTHGDPLGQAPIADLFPHCTILFADICGFTAWSSSREPAQVFILLQTVYQAFDRIAKQRKVFKVETIGDSYVAVTGCPEAQVNHAVIMARFAAECMLSMMDVVRDLETKLGPGTGDLMMRFGMNSGPVTAGVLRGERSRFQLFGDTMNTAARMESTGSPGMIQASQSTAFLLQEAGKGHWVRAREENIVAKGKGIVQTYWVTPHARKGTSNGSSETGSSDHVEFTVATSALDIKADVLLKHERYIDWVVRLMLESVRKIAAVHQAKGERTSAGTPVLHSKQGHIALDEVVEAIKLPEFDAKTAQACVETIEIPEAVSNSLREYVSIIASTYRDNPFHNFEHACHVTLSVSKFLSRVATPDMELPGNLATRDDKTIAKKVASHMHDYTHGITSDPITLFAIVFSALIHDVDHRGVSNVQLIKEEPGMAKLFRNKSVAEQNSLEIAWQLLVSERFDILRNYIFASGEELLRFRQIIVNVVLATDIFDQELNSLRKMRWDKAFTESNNSSRSSGGGGVVVGTWNRNQKDCNAFRATIVMEHIMQASDVCHTMQHWHVYRKWNQRLFQEMLIAHQTGRMGADPRTFWYRGELNFFDNYIIPLAKKLKDCNVFGPSSDECLNFALKIEESGKPLANNWWRK